MRGAIALILLLLPLSGCLDGGSPETAPAEPEFVPLTEALYTLGATETRTISSFDDTPLHVDIQFPEGDGPWPLLLQFTPYSALGEQASGTQNDLGQGRYMNGLASKYIPFGYAVAVAHVRGTGESGGCLTVGGPEEGLDGYELVEQLAAEEWSNGRVAMMGTSYVGTTPMQTAILNPPHLTTIIPKAGVTEWYRYYYENGIQRVNDDPPPGSDITDPAFWIALGMLPGWRTFAADPDDLPCTAEFTANFWGQDDYNDYWQARNHGQFANQSEVPMLFNHGWDDGNVGTSMIPAFWYEAGGENRAWLMQHGHGIPSSKSAYYEYEHRWLDHWMLDMDNGALDLPGVIIEDSDGKWRAEAVWPPVDTATQQYWLAEGGMTANEPSTGSVSYWNQVLPEQLGASTATFTTPPVAEDSILVGEVEMTVDLSTTGTDTQIGAMLWEKPVDGPMQFITRGYMDARHRESLETGRDMVPGQNETLTFLLHPQDYNMPAGSSLYLQLSGGDDYVLPEDGLTEDTIHFEGSSMTVTYVARASRTIAENAVDLAPHLFAAPE